MTKEINCIEIVTKSFFLEILFIYLFIYLFLDRGEGRQEERERNINVWLPLVCPPPGTWPTTQHVPLLGIKPVTLWFAGLHSIH